MNKPQSILNITKSNQLIINAYYNHMRCTMSCERVAICTSAIQPFLIADIYEPRARGLHPTIGINSCFHATQTPQVHQANVAPLVCRYAETRHALTMPIQGVKNWRYSRKEFSIIPNARWWSTGSCRKSQSDYGVLRTRKNYRKIIPHTVPVPRSVYNAASVMIGWWVDRGLMHRFTECNVSDALRRLFQRGIFEAPLPPFKMLDTLIKRKLKLV